MNSIRYNRLHRGSLSHVSLSHGWGYTVHDDPRARKSPQGPVHENRKGRRLSLLFFFYTTFFSYPVGRYLLACDKRVRARCIPWK